MKVYYKEDDLYPATYNFKDEVDGTSGTDIDGVQYNNLDTCEIKSDYLAHKKVLYIEDDGGGSAIRFDAHSETSGTFEFWLNNALADDFYIRHSDNDGNYPIAIYIAHKTLVRINYGNGAGGTLQHNVTIAEDEWFHVRVLFDCATDKQSVWINGILELDDENFDDDDTPDNFTFFQIYALGANEFYLDALGYSWDTDYNIGDNRFDVYHYYSRTQLTGIVEYPTIISRNNMYGSCSIIVRDFEGSLYDTWYTRDFNDVVVEDDDSNILFRGYLINKTFHNKDLELTIAGFGIKLDWKEFYKDYVLAKGLVKTAPANATLTLWRDVDEDEVYDGGVEDWDWAIDYWITDQDVGLLIVDNTSDLDSEIWECSTIAITAGGVEESGDKDSLDSQDGDPYYGTENSAAWDDYITIVLGEGTPFATAKKIHSIDITYRIGIYSPHWGVKNWYLEVKNSDNEWIEILHIPTGVGTTSFSWFSDTFTIPETTHAELLKFLTVDGADYDEVTELRVRWTSTNDEGSKAYIKIDVLTAEIKFFTDEINPIMLQITDSAANSVECVGITDWVKTGVIGYDDTAPGDIFRIGENTRVVVEHVAAAIAPINIEIIGQEGSGVGTFTLRPDGDGTQTEWSFDDSGGTGDHYKDVDEVVVDPNTGDGNIVKTHSEAWVQEEFTYTTDVMGGANVCTKIVLHTYGQIDLNTVLCRVSFYTTSTGWSATTPIVFPEGSYAWVSTTWDNLVLDQTDLDSLQIRYEGMELIPLGDYVSIDTSYIIATYGTYAPFNRFIAREYKGTHAIDVLKSVCDLEGADWMEDYVNHRIKLVKPSAYELSNVILTEADYDWDWEYEDKCNQVKRFDVFGNAAYNIHEYKISSTTEGGIARQIIDESIYSAGDALEVATVQLERYEVKRPSLKLTLDGAYPDLQLGKTVNVTLTRPTVAAADYKIRMIERYRKGIEGIKTVVYCGLGETADDEKIGMTIRKIGYLANRAMSDRLI